MASKIAKRIVMAGVIVSAASFALSAILLLEVPRSQVLMDGDKEPKTALQLPNTMMLVFDTADVQRRLKAVALVSGLACLGLVQTFKRFSKAPET